MTVSVVVAAYNGARTIEATIESVLAQTYRRLQIIVVDDGSTDETPRVLRAFGDRITVIRQENAGVSTARNVGAEIAVGSYLAFLDQDDLWEPDMLEVQAHNLEAATDCGLIYADSQIIDAAGRAYGLRSQWLGFRDGLVFAHLIRGNFIPIETMLIPRTVFFEVGGFDPRWRYLEDWDLCLKIAARYRIARTDRILARYRIHGGNLTHHREAICAEWADLLLSEADRLPDTASQLARSYRRDADRRRLEAAWHAIRQMAFDRAQWHRDRLKGRGPFGLALKVRLGQSVLRGLPAPMARRLAFWMRPRHAYGVPYAATPAIPLAGTDRPSALRAANKDSRMAP